MKDLKNWIIRNKVTLINLFIFVVGIWSASLLFPIETSKVKQETKTEQYQLPDGTKVSTVDTKKITEKELKKIVKQQNKPEKALIKEFSKVKNVTKTVQKTVIDSLFLPVNDSILIKKPYFGKYLKDNVSFDYEINTNGITLTSFTLVDTTTTVHGVKKKWIFGKEIDKTDVIHTDPNTETVNIESIVVKQKPPWYFSKVAWIVYSAIGIKTVLTVIK